MQFVLGSLDLDLGESLMGLVQKHEISPFPVCALHLGLEQTAHQTPEQKHPV